MSTSCISGTKLSWPTSARVGIRLLLIARYRARTVAAALALFSLAAAISFHSNFADQNQMIHFLKNVMMAGGLLQIAAFGGGALGSFVPGGDSCTAKNNGGHRSLLRRGHEALRLGALMSKGIESSAATVAPFAPTTDIGLIGQFVRSAPVAAWRGNLQKPNKKPPRFWGAAVANQSDQTSVTSLSFSWSA